MLDYLGNPDLEPGDDELTPGFVATYKYLALLEKPRLSSQHPARARAL